MNTDTFNPTKEQLQELIDKNYSSNGIAKHFGKSQGSIRFWLKKYGLKTNFKFREGGWSINKQCVLMKDRNWKEIQDFYNNNHSWTDAHKEFKISQHTIKMAVELDLLKSRTSNETSKLKRPHFRHTGETKQKLSIARKKYLLNNPQDKCWHKRDSKDSIPCKKVKELLIKNNIQFIQEFEPLLHLNRLFSIDIAFPDKKVGIEVNGGQHYDTNGNLKPYYQERHDLIESAGWKLYEIPYNLAFNEIKMLELVNSILNTENKLTFDYLSYKPRAKKPKPLPKIYTEKSPNVNGHPTKYKYPPDNELKILAESMQLQDLEKHLNIPKKALWSYLNNKGIKTKKRTVWR